jgi:hypothetical protein
VLWSTRTHLHLDRVATAWLILRFVDKQAQFVYVTDLREVPVGANPFGFQGVALSSHDDEGTTFRKTLLAYDLSEPALKLLERIVAEGVRHALKRSSEEPQPELRAMATALDGIGLGMGALFGDDDLFAAAVPMYDALYVLAQVWGLPPDQRDAVPPGPPDVRSAYLRRHLRMPIDSGR